MEDLNTAAPVVLLASGAGTLARSIIEHSHTPNSPYQVVGLVVDRPCAAYEWAQSAGIPAVLVDFASISASAGRDVWNEQLAEAVAEFAPRLVVSAGFMRIVGEQFLTRFGDRMINTHPALLPAFPGAHAVPDALTYGVQVTGSTVHWVDEGVDTGAIIAQRPVFVQPGDTVESLHERIKVVERQLVVEVIEWLVTVDSEAFASAEGKLPVGATEAGSLSSG